MGYNTKDSVKGLKHYILLNDDLKTPRLINIGATNTGDCNYTMPITVLAKDRREAKKFMQWILNCHFTCNDTLRHLNILDCMIGEVTLLEYEYPKIDYENGFINSIENSFDL